MRRALWFLPALLLVLAAPALSAPIVVSAGEVWTFNFDFGAAGVSPAPPYQFIQFDTGYDALTHGPGDFGLWTGFSELDGGGSQIFGPHGSALLSTLLPGDDGVFSLVMTVVSGSFTVDPLTYGFDSGVLITDPVAPTSTVSAAVPEPATLTLLGAGLAAAYRQRRRRAAA